MEYIFLLLVVEDETYSICDENKNMLVWRFEWNRYFEIYVDQL